ncbi:DHA2 family efflux MFS transporter permease subunit [Ktedonosporobacter rubrisoli]|uniref:DHA2 family efflux MFS transporter permease subunit n=1 Tax=Ktedonosporobacter rubrisoli TaxID=2509675 RepID=A0A4P6JW34_KTERU|nr:DHA2 family efflux MFS transporter permease subunit [Ktedonosporobacter rubrisoli]QBD79887.1 DHA2 family efflux MFS transporter permease subunit [Ktedonosporobacter rubrisoli]
MQANAQVNRQGLPYKWLVAIVIIIGTFMSILDSTIVNIAIPRLQTAFGADIHSVQWTITAYLLTLGAMTPAAPYLANTFGIKRAYITALGAFTLGSALCGLSWSLPVLIFFRVVQGLGGSALFPLSMTMLFREFPPEERGVAMATLGVPALLAPALGPILGGYLVTYAAWQAIFFINVPIGIVAILLSTFILREAHLGARSRFDWLGFITSAYGLAAVLYGLSETSTDGWGSTTVLAAIGSGALVLAIFVLIEINIAQRGGRPLLDVRFYTNRSFAASNLGFVFVMFSMYGGLFLLPIYLESLRNQSAFQAGLFLLPQALAAMVSISIGGRLVDRIGVLPVVIPGIILLAITNTLLASLSLQTPYGWFDTLLILRGFSNGLIGQPLMVAAMIDMRQPQAIADCSTLLTVVRSIAGSLGVAGLATLIQTQTQIHYVHLAEQVTPGSATAQMLTRLQALLMTHGLDAQAAYHAAILLVSRMVQSQGYMLAMRDAFYLTAALCVLALITVLLVRSRPRPVPAEEQQAPSGTERGVAEPALAG